MNWYVVKMIFQVVQEDAKDSLQYDEQFRLIRADSSEWALQKASTLGTLEDSAFLNGHRQEVKWKFIAVVDVAKVDNWEDGAELHASTIAPDNELNYLDEVHSRAKALFGLVSMKPTTEFSQMDQIVYKNN